MPRVKGDKIGPYEIGEPIGKGGMGEVYRARDSRLHRDVAIKFSSDEFSERFRREARIVAQLNHPNVCTLFDVGTDYLVMELVEGETLADRLGKGPMPLDQVLRLARQIADALEAAHEKGVIHRDLKPGNVMIRRDGTVKVLDFGLAKSTAMPTVGAEDTTIGLDQTEAGAILGTASYMSPEQAMGKPADRRSDIYSFGLVVYEMATGVRAHKGRSTAEILASVIHEEPGWERVAPQISRLLRRCLAKDPVQRQRHIGDVMALVDETQAIVEVAPNVPRKGRRLLWNALAAILLVVLVGGLLWGLYDRKSETVETIRFEIRGTNEYKPLSGSTPRISPDGKWVMFAGQGADGVIRMWLRRFDSVNARPLLGTEGATGAAWADDSRNIAFTVTPASFVPGRLMRVDITAGTPESVCNVGGAAAGATWNRDGDIVFADRSKGNLWRVSAAGGQPIPVTKPRAGEIWQHSPQFLPDGRRFLYFRAFGAEPAKSGVYLGTIEKTPEEQSQELILRTDLQAAFSALNGGQLVFQRAQTLFAQAFDPSSLKLKGEPVPIAQGVASNPSVQLGKFSVSHDGKLVYMASATSGVQLSEGRMDASDARLLGVVEENTIPVYSPDGRRLAFSRLNDNGGSDIWVTDLTSRSTTKIIQGGGRNQHPAWSPDGKKIVFSSDRSGTMDLYIKNADGSGEERLILQSTASKFAWDWSSNGFLIFSTGIDIRGSDLWALPDPESGSSRPIAMVKTPHNESGGRLSPDGRWLLYGSDDSGPSQWIVYVRPFDPQQPGKTENSPRWSVTPGYYPFWRSDGRAILFQTPSLHLSSVDVDAAKPYQTRGAARVLSDRLTSTFFGISPDGNRFATPASPSGEADQLTVVVNWHAGLSKSK